METGELAEPEPVPAEQPLLGASSVPAVPLFAFDQLASVTIGQPKEFDVLPKNRDAQSIEVTIRQAQHGQVSIDPETQRLHARPARIRRR